LSVRTLIGPRTRAFLDATPPATANPGFYKGKLRSLFDAVDIPNPSNIGSVVVMGRLPARAVILPQALLQFGAHGASVTVDVGVAGAPACLASAVSVANAGSSPLLEAMAANAAQRMLWQHAGLASDPGGELELIATYAGANVAVGTGFLAWSAPWSYD
jgi:hypothetical protein